MTKGFLLSLAFAAAACSAGAEIGAVSTNTSGATSGPGSATSTGGAATGTGAGGTTTGTGGAADVLCTNDPCTAEGCSPVLLFQFDPFSEGDLGVGAHEVCVSFMQQGTDTAEYACFGRCGGPPSVTTTDDGYAVGMLLVGDELISGAGVAFPNGFAKLWRRDLASAGPGSATLLWSTDVPFHFANLTRNGDALYFSFTAVGDLTPQGIYGAPYAGGPPQRIVDWRVAPVLRSMVRVDGTLYFSSDAPAHYGLYAVPVGGGTPKLVYAPTGLVTSLAASAGRLFWAEADADTGDGTLRSSALDGSDLVTLAQVALHVLDIAVDADAVYFATSGAGGAGIDAVPVSGGTITPVLAGVSRVDRLVQDAQYLFFVGGDGVYRLRKPGH